LSNQSRRRACERRGKSSEATRGYAWGTAEVDVQARRSYDSIINQRAARPKKAHLKRIGKYEVLRELGRGAMGVVYQARDPSIGRLVALKTITSAVVTGTDHFDRFRREAQAAGGLHHPNIVTIYEMGAEDSVPYLVMEYLDGEGLDHLIERRAALPFLEKFGYIVQLCRALQHAHENGVVHRDVKPANIVVKRDGTIRVVDFGIARLVDTTRTQTGVVMGTIGYMSPQQLHGQRADERSDIYAAGVVAYELIGGRRPFSGASHGALILDILSRAPEALATLAPGCPTELVDIIERAMHKEDVQRYQSMGTMLAEIEPVWKREQERGVNQLMEHAQDLLAREDYSGARKQLDYILRINRESATAAVLLEELRCAREGLVLKQEVAELIERGRRYLEQGLFSDALADASSALQLDPTSKVARDLLADARESESAASRALEDTSDRVPVLEHEYMLQDSAAASALRSSHSSVSYAEVRPMAEATVHAGARSVPRTRSDARLSSGTMVAVAPQVRPRPRPKLFTWIASLLACAGLFAALVYVRGVRKNSTLLSAGPSATVVGSPAPASVSIEDQQRTLIAQAHEAADANDYGKALESLDQAQKLKGPLEPLIQDLRHRFEVEQQDSGARDVARQERDLWTQGSGALAQNRLDQAEQAFRQILALPEGGRRREDARQQLEEVLPRRREEERLFAEAQQAARKGDPASFNQALKLLDAVIGANGPRRNQAQQLEAALRDKLNALDAKNRLGQQAIAEAAERARFSQLEEQFRQAQQRSDDSARQQLRDLLSQFRSIADTGGSSRDSARNYVDNLIPAALKDVEANAAKRNSDTADAARFNDAVSHYRRAVDAHDAAALRSMVLPEFQGIAAAGGPRAAEASHYASSLIPAAVREAMPWPVIGCPASALGLGPSIKAGDLVACGMLDSPKLKWVQFVWPEFPAPARQAGQSSGIAMLSVTVDENGNVADVRPRGAKDSYGFHDAALAAARQWKTNPPRAQGRSVKTSFAVDIAFSP
jgi:TonB family protein